MRVFLQGAAQSLTLVAVAPRLVTRIIISDTGFFFIYSSIF